MYKANDKVDLSTSKTNEQCLGAKHKITVHNLWESAFIYLSNIPVIPPEFGSNF